MFPWLLSTIEWQLQTQLLLTTIFGGRVNSKILLFYIFNFELVSKSFKFVSIGNIHVLCLICVQVRAHVFECVRVFFFIYGEVRVAFLKFPLLPEREFQALSLITVQ